jgi:hypothetical protein
MYIIFEQKMLTLDNSSSPFSPMFWLRGLTDIVAEIANITEFLWVLL